MEVGGFSNGNESQRKRSSKVSADQMNVLLSYMEERGEFAAGRFAQFNVREANERNWHELTNLLNSAHGPSKTVSQWQKTRSDYKVNTRRRAAEIRSARGKTGNAVPVPVLNAFDQRVLTLIGTSSSIGLPLEECGFGPRPQDQDGDFADSCIVEELPCVASPCVASPRVASPLNATDTFPDISATAVEQVMVSGQQIPLNNKQKPLKKGAKRKRTNFEETYEDVKRLLVANSANSNNCTAAVERCATAMERIAAATEENAAEMRQQNMFLRQLLQKCVLRGVPKIVTLKPAK